MGRGWHKSFRPPKIGKPVHPALRRDRIAGHLALLTAMCLGIILLFSKGTAILMPGPLASAHGAIGKCSACHTKSGSGKLSWVHGLIAGDPLADSKACLSCHKMPDTAFNAHGASVEVLKRSTERLTRVAMDLPEPHSSRAQNFAFPAKDVVEKDLYCATCHQDHQGANFSLSKISNEQCRSCHVVKFDSFSGDHPKFENYPFERRTRIIYDHAAHFGKHYQEVAKKEPAKRIPETCSSCHDSREDKRVMAVAPFEKTCAACHLDQITGKERVSGPKGIAFLALPGLDLESLKEKNVAIGEWPDGSDAALTPFMKVMISRSERGRAVIKTIDSLNLQDLSQASDEQIQAVGDLVMEIKTLIHALITGKVSDVLGGLSLGGGETLSANHVSDLTASLPRDVVIRAQQQWLPNLGAEMTNGLGAINQQPEAASVVATEPVVTGAVSPSEAPDSETQRDSSEETEEIDKREETNAVKRDPPACALRLLGQCLMSKDAQTNGGDGQLQGEATKSKSEKSTTATSKSGEGKKARSAEELPGRMNAGVRDAGPVAQPETAKPDAGKEPPAASKVGAGKAPAKTGDQADELLFPTEEELREITAHNKNSGKVSQPGSAPAPAGAVSQSAPSNPQSMAPPDLSIVSGVDPESWAEFGGWYQQDYAIFYRPAGHKDKFIASWLTLTGLQAAQGDKGPLASVFHFLTSKDAQGSCVKCHSVDAIQGKGRVVNFAPLTVQKKQGRFTQFIHEPHFGVVGDRGCLTCHELPKDQQAKVQSGEAESGEAESGETVPADGAAQVNAAALAETQVEAVALGQSNVAEKSVSPYLKSYEQSNPHIAGSEFNGVNKDLCRTCHKSSRARQDCLTCHKYHVNDVVTPITHTKNPMQ